MNSLRVPSAMASAWCSRVSNTAAMPLSRSCRKERSNSMRFVFHGTGPMVRDPHSGKYRRTRLFVLTLNYRRKSVRLLVFRSSSHIWAQVHEKAFRWLGGWLATRTRQEWTQFQRSFVRRLGRLNGAINLAWLEFYLVGITTHVSIFLSRASCDVAGAFTVTVSRVAGPGA